MLWDSSQSQSAGKHVRILVDSLSAGRTGAASMPAPGVWRPDILWTCDSAEEIVVLTRLKTCFFCFPLTSGKNLLEVKKITFPWRAQALFSVQVWKYYNDAVTALLGAFRPELKTQPALWLHFLFWCPALAKTSFSLKLLWISGSIPFTLSRPHLLLWLGAWHLEIPP